MSTILIVEDAPIISQPIEAALKREGYETIVAENGAEGLKRLAEKRPDLILLDLAMPVMDGIQFLRTIRGNEGTRGIPVIVLTAIAEKPRVVEAVKYGISAYLLKSRFSLRDMLDQIARTLQSPEGTIGQAGSGAASAAPGAGQSLATGAPSSTSTSQPVASPVPTGPSVGVAPAQQAVGTSPAAESLDGLSESARAFIDECREVDPAEALKRLKPAMTRSQITERLEDGAELKGMSPAVGQVLKLTGSARCSIEQVAKAISQDHGMALKILKLANSAVYTRGEPVDTVQMAVTRIGLEKIRQTVLNLSVVDRFNTSDDAMAINCGQFWEHAIATGLIAAEITYHRNEKEADMAFTMGLLHDVGRMYLSEEFSETYRDVLGIARALQLPVEQVESRLMIFSHADIMDRMLHQWKFPKQLINPIVFHHLSAGNIRRSAPRQILEVATLGLANRLAHALMLGTSGNETIYPTEDLCELLKLEPKVIEEVHRKTREECDKVKFALLANTSNMSWTPLRDQYRKALSTPVRPIFISMAPQYDAYRIFFEELTAPIFEEEYDGEQAPNLGVIHLTNARDRVNLTRDYRMAEQKHEVSNLPLLILSPAGKILPENGLLNGRTHHSLPTPVTAARLLDAINQVMEGTTMQAAA